MKLAGIVVSALIGLALGASAPSAVNLPPRLRLVDRSPFTVDGRSFNPSERVRVTVSASGVVERKTVRTSRPGSFRAVFAGLTLGPCTGFRVSASGSRGSRAKLSPPPLPACMPASSSG